MNSFYLNREIITRSRTITVVGCMLAASYCSNYTSTSVSAQAPEVLIIGSHGNGSGQFNLILQVLSLILKVTYLSLILEQSYSEIYESNGTFVSQWGTFGDGPGNFNDPLG